jgi:phosphatidylserine/phosphatidylglycerophosphate/cardiolipin synthase-like enzyme
MRADVTTTRHEPATVDVRSWFLNHEERGNPSSNLDGRHHNHTAWSAGNDVRALVHGTTYFAELLVAIRALRAGDLLLFTDWRSDPDERLAGRDSELTEVLCAAAERGVLVKGLVWRSHWDRLKLSSRENRQLGEDIEAAGGECLLDTRVRLGGSHHQKLVVLRHAGRPELDTAYVGGIDLCRGRRDDGHHRGDDQAEPISDVYGPQPPWHDIQVAIRGPAVGDVEAVFRERWTDPTPLSRNPLHRLRDLLQRTDTRADPLPAQLPDPQPSGKSAVQLLRTYPYRRPGYPFAAAGERSIARGYGKALRQARSLIYIEDQYLWSEHVAQVFADALITQPQLHLIAVLPMHPDQEGLSGAAQMLGRQRALQVLQRAGGGRVACYGLENRAGTPIYVHAKACIVDDRWACVGSDNLNLRSWTHDSELCCAVIDEDATGNFGAKLRLTLCREHLDRADGQDEDLRDAVGTFAAFRDAAQALDAWHAGHRAGPRPPGRLRRLPPSRLSAWALLCAPVLYRHICDPDGRPPALRRDKTF